MHFNGFNTRFSTRNSQTNNIFNLFPKAVIGESISVSLGTTYSCAVRQNCCIEIIANSQGNSATSLYVALTGNQKSSLRYCQVLSNHVPFQHSL